MVRLLEDAVGPFEATDKELTDEVISAKSANKEEDEDWRICEWGRRLEEEVKPANEEGAD